MKHEQGHQDTSRMDDAQREIPQGGESVFLLACARCVLRCTGIRMRLSNLRSFIGRVVEQRPPDPRAIETDRQSQRRR